MSFYRIKVLLGFVLIAILSGLCIEQSTAIYAKPLATNVGGTITTNTTWTPAGSPYIMTGSVTVTQGINLTIEPGVVQPDLVRHRRRFHM